MSLTPPDRPSLLVLVLALFLAPAGPTRADGPSLGDLAATLNIDRGGISVSGISSGAYMAQQFHVIHSRHVIGDGFYGHAGYNEIAETNDIVVLYPQTKAWSENFLTDYARNPRACWDWWGYSGNEFHRRSGKQVRAVAGMINTLVGGELLRSD